MLHYYCKDGFFWFRLFGYGLYVKDTNKHPMIFSERYGLRKTAKIKSYIIGLLKPIVGI